MRSGNSPNSPSETKDVLAALWELRVVRVLGLLSVELEACRLLARVRVNLVLADPEELGSAILGVTCLES